MENNNDISLFEKIVFVDNIPSEDEAQRLSSKYPFAVFISDHDNTYNENITNIYEASNERDWNQFAFNNLWKGGKRLTKFNNIDFENSSVNMDTFTIDLEFDMQKGLLSLKAKAKVDGYKIVGFIQRKGEEDYVTYLNKKDILKNIRSRSEEDHHIENITENEFENDSAMFDEFTTDTFYNNKVLLGFNNGQDATDGFDTIDNKFYIIVSFEAQDVESLYSVPANAYNIYSIDDEFSVTAAPMFIEDKLKQIININNTEEKENLIQSILKYTKNISYSGVKQRCVIYEISINKNVEPDNQDDDSLVSFGFESLKNIQQMDIAYLFSYVNPTGFELKANIENNWVTIDQNNSRENYFMPGTRTEFMLNIYPENVRKLKLPISVTSREQGGTTEYLIYDTDTTSTTLYNFNTQDPDSIPTNSVIFSIYTPSDFIYDNAQTAFLNLQCRNYKDYPWSTVSDDGLLRYKCNEIKLTQYIYKELELSNPWSNSNVIKSGDSVDYSMSSAYALFYNNDNSITKKWIITDSDDDFKGLLIIHQHSENNVDLSTISNPLILEDTTVSTPELDKYSQYITTHNIPIGTQKTITIPWISSTTETVDGSGKRRTNDYIYGLYSYHGYEKKDFNKYIKQDTLKNIYIVTNAGTQQNPDYKYGLQFTKSIYEGDEDLYIEKGDYVETINGQSVPYIAFEYEKGQIINGYHWFFNDNMTNLKNKLVIQYKIGQTTYNVPSEDISIVNNQIKIKSGEDVENARYYTAYIKIDDFISNNIEAMAEKLLVDWWIYIGKFNTTTSGNTIVYNPISSLPTTTVPTGFILKEDDSRNNLNDADPAMRVAMHKGGWIHLGKVELRDARLQRYDPNGTPPGYVTINSVSEIWPWSSNCFIDSETTREGEQYIIILPKDLFVKDTIDECSQNLIDNNYVIQNNNGNYIEYLMDDGYGYGQFNLTIAKRSNILT